jgi:hypothetical protein
MKGSIMIKIFTSAEAINQLVKQGYQRIEILSDKYRTVVSYEEGMSDGVKNIIETIDGCKVEGANIISKFTNVPIGIDAISDGAKTCIYVYFRARVVPDPKEIINITECGPNAIEYILKNFSDSDLTLMLYHYNIPSHTEVEIIFDNVLIHNTDEILLHS